MRHCIALWLLAWISIEVVLIPVSHSVSQTTATQFNSITTLHPVLEANFDYCVLLLLAGIGWWPLVSLNCVPVAVHLWISVVQHHLSDFESANLQI